MADKDSDESLEIDKYLNDSSEVVDRDDLNEKVRVLNKSKFENYINDAIDQVVEQRNVDLTRDEKKDVTEIIKEEIRESGVSEVEKYMRKYFSKVKKELSSVIKAQSTLKKFFKQMHSEITDLKDVREDQELLEESVSEIKEEVTNLQNNDGIEDTLKEFAGEIKDELSNLKEDIEEIPATARDFREIESEGAEEAGAIVQMMSEEEVSGNISAVDREEESEDVDSEVERLKQLKEENEDE